MYRSSRNKKSHMYCWSPQTIDWGSPLECLLTVFPFQSLFLMLCVRTGCCFCSVSHFPDLSCIWSTMHTDCVLSCIVVFAAHWLCYFLCCVYCDVHWLCPFLCWVYCDSRWLCPFMCCVYCDAHWLCPFLCCVYCDSHLFVFLSVLWWLWCTLSVSFPVLWCLLCRTLCPFLCSDVF